MQAVAHTEVAALVPGTVDPVQAPKSYTGRRGTALLILNIGARRRPVVDITLRPLYHRERTPVPIKQKAGWAPQQVCTPCTDSAPAARSTNARQRKNRKIKFIYIWRSHKNVQKTLTNKYVA
jgi:hypothetical protein